MGMDSATEFHALSSDCVRCLFLCLFLVVVVYWRQITLGEECITEDATIYSVL